MKDLNWTMLAPLAVIQGVLWIVCLTDLARRKAENVRFGHKWPWVLMILLISCGIGSVLYLTAGRTDGSGSGRRRNGA